jgi:hypothetical protein
MTTALWFVFALVVLQLGALACLWILYLIREHSGARHEPPREHPGTTPVSPPAA